MSGEVDAKHARLCERLASYGRVLVAFSGGVDSTFLLKVAKDVLGDSVRALTARSPSLMAVELEDAVRLAQSLGVEHDIVDTAELAEPGYVENSTSRCYFCKTELFDSSVLVKERDGFDVIADGFNADDFRDHRPGHRAAQEHGVCHPLAEVGLNKSEIRSLSKTLGLPTWNKPQLACLASRIPYGMEVSKERLARVEAIETALRRLQFFDVRARLVRGNEDMVRIEVGSDELARALDPTIRRETLRVAHSVGFRFVTLDLEGFRSGRLNEGIAKTELVSLRSSGV